MTTYLTRATQALDGFDGALATLTRAVTAAADAGDVPSAMRTKLADTIARLERASTALRRSFDHLAHDRLDIVDLQARLEGETAALASALRALGEIVEGARTVGERLMPACVGLEEAASALASATFPSAVEGLTAVNRALWDFQGPVWKAYERKLAEVVAKRSLTSTQVAKIEETAREVRSRFEAVNSLINDLAASGFSDRAAIAAMITGAKRALTGALASARSRAADAYKPFHGVLGQAEAVATRVNKQLDKCRIPVFPRPDGLDQARELVDADMYAGLSGAGRFALINILAGLRTIPVDGADGHLLSPRFVRRVFAAFPDRIYFEATPALLAAIDDLKRNGTFASAPAALHKFRDGSVKQRQHRKGNLQLSYEQKNNVVRVDADIDLYRGPVSHLFGEVLVNHLTGSTTCQFTVRNALDARGVVPIGGFEVWSPIG
jgi:hypothetical protein